MQLKDFWKFAFALCSTLPLSAETVYDICYPTCPEVEPVKTEAVEDCCNPCCRPWAKSKWLSLRQLEGQGIGFNNGYTSLELFLSTPNPMKCWIVPFLDLRGHRFNGGNYAANVGIGSRFLLSEDCSALGANLYYDYRHTHRKNYNQIGLGLEYLNPTWEVRANGYFPVGSRQSAHFDSQFFQFSGNNFLIKSKRQFALTGANIEAGWHFFQACKFDFFAAAGAYVFKGSLGKAAIGGKARLAIRYGQYVSIEASDSYDQVFHNRLQGQFSISIPFGPVIKPPRNTHNCCCDDQLLLQEWIYDAPQRQEIVVIDTKKKTSVAIDPVTGEPFNFIFVDNTSSSDGTFESPFPTLAQAQAASAAGDVIYVFPGDGTTTGMNTGMILQNAQRFLGSGVAHGFQTQLGSIEIPAQTPSLPNITNVGTVVTLALNNEVSGFRILGGSPSITGTFTNVISSVNINQNQIVGSLGNAIVISPVNSAMNIFIDGNTIDNPVGIGIESDFQNSTGTVTVQNNDISFGDSLGISMEHSALSQVAANVLHNIIDNVQDDSIEIHAIDTGTFVQSFVSGNTIYSIYNNDNQCIDITAQDGATHATQINNNLIEIGFGSTNDGIILEVSGVQPSTLIASLVRNQITGGADGIIVHTAVGSTGSIQAEIANNLVIDKIPLGLPGVAGGAILIAAEGFGIIQGEIFGNMISSCGTVGLAIFGAPFPTIPIVGLNIFSNTFVGCEEHAIQLNGNGFMQMAFSANLIKGNGLSTSTPSTFFLAPTSGSFKFFVNDNLLVENFNDGFTLAPQTASVDLCLLITNNVTATPLFLDNTAGANFNVEPPSNNTSGISVIEPITFVPPGTCTQ